MLAYSSQILSTVVVIHAGPLLFSFRLSELRMGIPTDPVANRQADVQTQHIDAMAMWGSLRFAPIRLDRFQIGSRM